jgi:hypothetical protein
VTDDDRPRPWRRQVVGAVVVLAVVALAVLVVALRDASDADQRRSRPTSTSTSPATDPSRRDAAAIDVLSAQDRALRAGDRIAYVSTWRDAIGAQREADTVFDNLRALRIRDLRARYVGPDPGGLDPSELRRFGESAWTAEVDTSWTLNAGPELTRPVRSTLIYTFAGTGDNVRVADIRAASGERTPVWLLGRLDVRRSPRTLVVATDADAAARVDTLVRSAVDDVQAVVPDWDGDLVSIVPSRRDQFDELVAAPPHAYEGIAAVTTTVDGSRDPRAPVAIVVNPDVFKNLGPVGAHVVISHEATHLATGATTVTMPLWVAEGFADYVGVGSVDVPLRVSAGQAIRDIRKFGVPERLPSNGAFQARDGVEATYEESWLAFRLMAAKYGQARVVAFYEDVVRRPRMVAEALRRNLGLSLPQLTREWRSSLRDLAGAN